MQGSGWRGGLGGLPTPLWSCVQGACAGPCFCSWLLISGSWVFLVFLSIICPNCACTQLFLVPYSFFVSCCLRRGVSRCKPCSRGSQVPVFLTPSSWGTGSLDFSTLGGEFCCPRALGVCKAAIMALSHEVGRKSWKYNQTGPCIGALEMWEDPGDGDPRVGVRKWSSGNHYFRHGAGDDHPMCDPEKQHWERPRER